jgi:glycosyltransferase involved in cell wall biosynthesis
MINSNSQVTVCIPAYNAERYISQTLISILKQSQQVREVFVSDNHSTDQTRAVVAQFKERGVELVQCPIMPVKTGSPLDNSRSSGNNWSSLVQYGSGKYIALYHADDVYEPEIVEAEVKFLEEHPECSVIFTLGILIDEKDRQIHLWNAAFKKWLGRDRVFDYPSLVQGLLEWGCFLWAPTAMIRRETWHQVGGINQYYEQAADMEWWLRFAKAGPVGVLNRELFRRRVSRYHDSANAKIIYRYRELPFFNVMQDCLNRNGLRLRIPGEILLKYELQRVGDLVGPGVMYITEGKMHQGLEKLESSAQIGIGELARSIRTYPRSVLQVLFGKALRYACQIGCGRVVAQHLAKRSSIFSR